MSETMAKQQQTASVPSAPTPEERMAFDEVAWGSHCVDCYPGACPYRVFVRDEKIVREEVAGTFPQFEDGVPDMNPLGCQKGAAWSQQQYSADRLLHPLRRVGPRGSGEFEEISWEEALDDVADALLDAIEKGGTESIVHEGTPEVVVVPATHRFVNLIGGIVTDINGSINDLALGHHLTFGRFYPTFSNDDLFHSDVLLLWNTNPAYTCIPFFHYIVEARYRGADVVLLSPDVSPSHSHVDYHVPVAHGSDPALALSMCQVVVEEDLLDEEFVASQTDLSFLTRVDDARFLRQSDLVAGGSDEVFYHWHPDRGPVEADRSDLRLDFAPRLRGVMSAELADGSVVEVQPLFNRLAEMLSTSYRPEQTLAITGTHPDTVRTLARKIARRRTKVLMGMGACKTYHSDLYQRTMNLLLALTGNWGKKGTGINCWAVGLFDGQMTALAKTKPGVEGAEEVLTALDEAEAALRAADPTLNDELASIELWRMLPSLGRSAMVPAFFFWYWHCGFKARWGERSWNDPTMLREFDDYVEESLAQGWWRGLDRPGPGTPPKVLIECGGNTLRRTRGGQGALLPTLWPQLDLIVTIDTRMSTTCLHSDIVLPAATHYEKVAFHLPSPSMLVLTLSDKAAEPPGEAKDEWEIFGLLCQKMAERARARDLEEFTIEGTPGAPPVVRRFDSLWDEYTSGGRLIDSERVAEEMVADTVHAGTLPEGVSLTSLRRDGWTRFTGWGRMTMAKGQSSPWPEHETHVPFRNHVEKGYPYPTLTRRAQFLIEHPWYVEAGEDLPVHKDPPKMGGDHPFAMSGGHNRWSIHSMNMGNPVLLQTHRGEPFIDMHPVDAAERGIADGGRALVRNDVGEFTVRIRVSPGQRPHSLTIYNGWDPFQFENWKGPNETEPGMVKWLHLAGGYGHLRYAPMEWQPSPVDRPVFVTVERAP